MRIGIGYAKNMDVYDLGKRSAQMALSNRPIEHNSVMLAFCHGHLDHDKFIGGIRSEVGKTVPIIGGSTIGIITNDIIDYEYNPAGVLLIESDKMQINVASIDDINVDEAYAGSELGKKIVVNDDTKLLLLFYDSIKTAATQTSPPIMNSSRPLLDGLSLTLARKVPIYGVGVMGSFAFDETVQYNGTEVHSQSAVAAIISGDYHIYSRIVHGCTPMDGIYHKITKVHGSIIYEIDGKPAVAVIDAVYGNQDWQQQHPVRLLTLGINYGAKFAKFREGNYVNRLITGVLPDLSGICLFEADLENDTEFQFMVRDSNNMTESAKINAAAIIQQIKADGKKPYIGFYIDCAGRSALVSNSEHEEASEVQTIFNEHHIPLFGIYSGVEIAPVFGKSRGLDWTGVLIVLAE